MNGLSDKFAQSTRLDIIRDLPFEAGRNQLGDDAGQHGINDDLRISIAINNLLRRTAKHGRPEEALDENDEAAADDTHKEIGPILHRILKRKDVRPFILLQGFHV